MSESTLIDGIQSLTYVHACCAVLFKILNYIRKFD